MINYSITVLKLKQTLESGYFKKNVVGKKNLKPVVGKREKKRNNSGNNIKAVLVCVLLLVMHDSHDCIIEMGVKE